MKRKLFSFLIAMLMGIALLAGCGDSKSSNTDSGSDTNISQNDEMLQQSENQETTENEEDDAVRTDIKEVILKDANTGEETYSLTLTVDEYIVTWNQLTCKNGLTQLEGIDANGQAICSIELHLNKYSQMDDYREEQLSAEDAYGKGWYGYQWEASWDYPFVQERHFIGTERDGDLIFAVLLPNGDLITGSGVWWDYLFENGITYCETKANYSCTTGLTKIIDPDTGEETEINERETLIQNLKEGESISLPDEEGVIRTYINWNGYIREKYDDEYYVLNNLIQKICYADYYEIIIEYNMGGSFAGMKLPGDVDAKEYLKQLTEEVAKQGYSYADSAKLKKIDENQEDKMLYISVWLD